MFEAPEKETPVNRRELKLKRMALDESHIAVKALETVTAPTLILVGDHGVIREEHTVEILLHIRNSQLCIFPNSTPMCHTTTLHSLTRPCPLFSHTIRETGPHTGPDEVLRIASSLRDQMKPA